jgi:hypothetical protein
LTWQNPTWVLSRVYVYRAQGDGDFYEVAALDGSAREWSDLGAKANVLYNYKVKVFSSLVGLSAPSNVDAGFRLDPPAATDASQGTGSSVRVSWIRPSTWEGSVAGTSHCVRAVIIHHELRRQQRRSRNHLCLRNLRSFG